MISAPFGIGFPLSAHVLGKRLVICLGSFFIFFSVWSGDLLPALVDALALLGEIGYYLEHFPLEADEKDFVVFAWDSIELAPAVAVSDNELLIADVFSFGSCCDFFSCHFLFCLFVRGVSHQ